jgi:hypothetical protein
MSSAARPQPESEQVEAVVSVRGDSLREARIGLVMSLCLLTALVAVHPRWSVLAVFATGELVSTVYAAIRAVFTFRDRLDEAEPLPPEAVEATGAPKRRPLDWNQALGAVLGITAIGAAVVFGGSGWVARIAAVGIAAVIAYRLVRPLAIAYLATRWERTHGHGRLFRPLVRENEDGEETLYVADRPVPAA